MDTFCPTLSSDPAIVFAEGGYDLFMTLGKELYQLAEQELQALSAVYIQPITFNADFDFDGQLTPFQRPPTPDIDWSQFGFRDPGGVVAPPTFTPNDISLDPAPDASDLTPPTITFAPPPDTPVVAEPVQPTPAAPIVVPDAPAYTLPDLPTLNPISLPPVPAITIPTFAGERPTFIEPPLDLTFQYTPGTYASALLDKLKTQISSMMDGGTGLPPAIEQALFDRGRSRITVEVERNIEGVYDEVSARGFTEPNGILAARVRKAKQDGQDKVAEINRDLTIQFHQEQLQNLRFAVTQGIALEGVTIALFNAEQQLALQVAQYTRETVIALFNARIQVFNAELAAFQTDAQVFATLIQAEMAKVELYRAQIEAQQAIGEVNQQLVAIYTAQVQTVGVMAEFYKAQIAGVQAKVDANRGVIENYRATVDALTARWQAYTAQVQGYTASTEVQNVKAGVYRTVVDAYGTRVSAWNTQQTAKFETERLRIADNGQRIETWKALLEQNQNRLETERARLVAVASSADAMVRLYAARTGLEQAASAATDRTFELGLEKAKAMVDVELKSAEIRIQENNQLLSLMVDIRKTLAQVSAQLAASIHSTMSFSTGISSSRGDSKSCSTSLSYQGNAPDLDS
ncbi:MAG: hypothetical protein JSS23_00170 [Proteobacteria bacterium]|nr:hypothetical protein [Pseudomonadota bacterium]